MAFPPKSKVPELSGIPWGRRKSRTPKPRVPWAKSSEKSPARRSSSSQHHPNRIDQGFQAETRALRLLESRGLVLVSRNHRCRCGELDLIMAQGDTAVVVEVRLRNSDQHGSALESISTRKQTRVSRCARLWWVQEGQRQFRYLRFDVVALENNSEPQWVQNAWQISN